jgi:hypothetical protein
MRRRKGFLFVQRFGRVLDERLFFFVGFRELFWGALLSLCGRISTCRAYVVLLPLVVPAFSHITV